MNPNTRIPASRGVKMSALKLSIVAGAVLSLSGCIAAIPPAVQMASLALDGVSLVATGKTVTDHAISAVANKDCAMGRALKGDAICTPAEDPEQDVQLAARFDAYETAAGTPVPPQPKAEPDPRRLADILADQHRVQETRNLEALVQREIEKAELDAATAEPAL